MKKPFRRLLGGLGMLVAVGALAVSATTSVFAFHQGFTQSSAANPGPLNTGASVAPSSITPGLTASFTSNYSYTAASTPVGATGVAASLPAGQFGIATQGAQNTTIGTMYQQWRHTSSFGFNPMDRWFYLYAGNTNAHGTTAQQSAASLANPTFAYYYYTNARGQTAYLAASVPAGVSSGVGAPGVVVGSVPAGTTTSGVPIYLDAGLTFPIASVMAMVANVPACGATAIGQRCAASFVTGVRWGVSQEAWPAGSVSLTAAVESLPLSATGNPTAGVIAPQGTTGAQTYADPWGTNASSTTLTLTNTVPAQSASGVTNLGTTAAPPQRFTSTALTFAQTVTDTNADLLGGSLIFVYTSGVNGPSPGNPNGQWFRVGFVNSDNQDNAILAVTSGCEYESWNETVRKSVGCTAVSGNYVNSYTAAATGTIGGGGTGEIISHTINFSPNAIGTTTVYARGEDYHGGTSGNVGVGAIAITLLPE